MDLPDLNLHRERAAVHRLVDSMWWGPADAPLEIATLGRCRPAWGWIVFALALVVVLLAPGGC